MAEDSNGGGNSGGARAFPFIAVGRVEGERREGRGRSNGVLCLGGN